MEITARELRDIEITEAFRGYNRDVVNDLLERAAATVEAGEERVRELTERLNAVQLEADRGHETEDILHRTLLLAQRAADEAVAEAQQKSRVMMEEAELESHRLLAEAQSEAQRTGDAERVRLEDEVIDLAARRQTLLTDVDVLEKFESEYRARVATVLEADLDALRNRTTVAPGPVPDVHPIEVPVAQEASAEPVDVSFEGSGAEGIEPEIGDASPESDEVEAARFEEARPDEVDDREADDVEADDDEVAEVDVDDDEVATSEETADRESAETDVDAGADNGMGADRANDDEPTRQVDVMSFFDAEAEAAGPDAWPPSPALGHESEIPAPALAASDNGTPITGSQFDLLRPDVLDAEVLDDDAFFATLREAVHDDTPLGPRDERTESGEVLTETAERGSFRDVFRRKR